MSRAGLRAVRFFSFSALVRPRALLYLAVLSLAALLLLSFGLTHGSRPFLLPPSDVRCFILNV